MEVWIEIDQHGCEWPYNHVTSLVEVWIEMSLNISYFTTSAVTSLVEVWIEIILDIYMEHTNESLPLWKCGLKSPCHA